ncbi:folate-dependent tRNA-U54 methylase TrmFO/GidA [Clostridium acetobutylicum]|nr:hypothetical protein NL50_01210 [Clostridium acetobutylicum]NOV88956.1 folate-dependent tRNA-U54 methylase TrmFO/GidA [Clostridium acetobutylicum]NOW12706.1 folate-dependent tRNA-U54 methylase TrmFO/GidA [Clostridium acetobutylicum]NRY55082.1 folate-dependent tRNA-U54 methylase TrmFO/GidA [Clostridium acetobutylicum]NSA93071.1 folate-dependent tRNA-U54 methylase TrmFO/GidA [Clostridium acetobutylicum]
MKLLFCIKRCQAEAICTGSLAGHNAVRKFLEMSPLILPQQTSLGDIISYANYKLMTKEGRRNRYTFAGAEYFKRMKEIGLYSTDTDEIKDKISSLHLTNIFDNKLL